MDYKIDFTKAVKLDAEIISASESSAEVLLGKAGGGLVLFPPEEIKHYFTGYVEVCEEHSVAMELRIFRKGESRQRIGYRFGLLPKLRTLICLDMELLDSRTIFTQRTPGTLKMVVHGNRTEWEDVGRCEFGMKDCFHDVRVKLSDFRMTDERPEEFPLPDAMLVDKYGQWIAKDYEGKVKSDDELREVFEKNLAEAKYPYDFFDKWGGDSRVKLAEGTGFFKTIKTADGKWHIADPDGNEFYSNGCDCVNPGDAGRIDDFAKYCELPPSDDPLYGECYSSRRGGGAVLYNHTMANLKRIYGGKWFEKWKEMTESILMRHGFNTIANWSNEAFRRGEKKLPFVLQCEGFPSTEKLIFRDFPDVLSEEYAANAKSFAKKLLPYARDSWLIGYFLRNEPEFAFVPNLLIADEVLRNPYKSYCRAGIKEWLVKKYGDIDSLNSAWNSAFTSFDDFDGAIPSCVDSFPASKSDLAELSKMLIEAYVGIPSKECRAVDPDHLNLGMRWAMANTVEQLAGWENFDVFSINSYSFSPYDNIDFAAKAGVDRPLMVGEFHFGALDKGMTATGLKAVKDQTERGKAYRYYVEHCASHPNAVGAHWFQYNDQSCIGRYDGENYQIGLVDVCCRPYEGICDAAKESAGVIYDVKNGKIKPYDIFPDEIPMIGY